MSFSGVYNNLVRFDPIEGAQQSGDHRPGAGHELELGRVAEPSSRSSCAADVKWHDGHPFTAKDVQCTFHRLNGKEPDYLRRNPARHLVREPDRGDAQRRPRGDVQPEEAAGLAAFHAGSGYTAIYPCHVAGRDMRVEADRHRAVQVRRVQEQRGDPAREEPGLLEARACPISTRSSGASCPTARRAFSPSRPASST